MALTGGDNHLHCMFQNVSDTQYYIITADLNPASPRTIGDGPLRNGGEFM